jgi:predicted nucleic acid-binding protein
MVYADSSVLASLYLKDSHSAAALKLVETRPALCLTPLHIAECFHAFMQQAYFGKITESDASRLCDLLRQDRSSKIWYEAAVPEYAFESCAELARKYGRKLGVRTLDSLHVACALELKAERFWTFDERQGKLAKAEGLKIA